MPRIKIKYSCSNKAKHEHRWRWTAWLCGQTQAMAHRPLRLLNPLIWAINAFSYSAHMHHYAELNYQSKHGGTGHEHKYEPYDFSRDIKYFK